VKHITLILGSLGNYNHFFADMKTAARLGYERAQDFIRTQGIDW
jgi:hypothetical protein